MRSRPQKIHLELAVEPVAKGEARSAVGRASHHHGRGADVLGLQFGGAVVADQGDDCCRLALSSSSVSPWQWRWRDPAPRRRTGVQAGVAIALDDGGAGVRDARSSSLGVGTMNVAVQLSGECARRFQDAWLESARACVRAKAGPRTRSRTACVWHFRYTATPFGTPP